MSNRVTLEQLDKMSETDAAGIHIGQLAMLLEDVAELKAAAARYAERIAQILDKRYGTRAAELRRAKGTDTGTVRVEDDDYVVIADLPKTVSWDQDSLAKLEKSLTGMGEDPAEYIRIKREVEERRFAGWPSSLTSMFMPARTVKSGKPTFKIEMKKGGK